MSLGTNDVPPGFRSTSTSTHEHKRGGNRMKKPFHDPKPTTNVASRERAAKRDAKRDIRTDEATGYGYARDWSKRQQRKDRNDDE
jgi:hypothetical protein